MGQRAKKFFSFYKPYTGLFIADMAAALAIAGISLVNPLIVRYITNHVLVEKMPSEALTLILQLGAVLLGLAFLQFGCNYFVSYQGHVMGAKMEYDMRNEIFSHYQKLSFRFYDNRKIGQLMSRVTNDLFDITELCHHGPEDLLISIIKFAGAFIILLRIHMPLTLIVFAFMPLMFFFSMFVRKKMRRAFRRNREKIADINAHIEDSLSGIRVVKSFARENLEVEKFRSGNDRFLDSKRGSYRVMASFHSGLSFFIALINIAVLTGGAAMLAGGNMNPGDLIIFILYINNLIEPVNKLINFTEQFQNGITGFERFMEIIEVEPDIVDQKGAVELKDARGEILFQNVSFQYEDNQPQVFAGINLSIKAGEYVAVVGSSGVGKTTMCSLIPRFYEVSGGQILVDGHDIRSLTLRSLRDAIGVVQQDVYLFAGTVKDNIGYGKPEATLSEIMEAAKRANAHEFIMELSDGYDTDIGQRGVKLSGGQKQRLSIARLFLKNPPVLILDEATSALDNESEKVVRESLDELAKGRTTLVIAHRLTTVRNAGRILVLTENGIAEEGSHEELLKKGGLYHSLYEVAQH